MVSLVAIAVAFLLSIIANAVLISIQDNLAEMPTLAFDMPGKMSEVLGGADIVTELLKLITIAGISFLTMLTLKKGLETYALHTDGDPDADPILLLTRYCKAMAVIGFFNPVLKEFSGIISKFTTVLNRKIINVTGTNWDGAVKAFVNNINEDTVSTNFLSIVLAIIFGVIFIILYFGIMKNGVEMIVLQLGVPFAVAGLLNADGGIFKGYVMSVVKIFVTMVVKIVLTQIGFSLVIVTGSLGTGNTFGQNVFGVALGIIFVSTALASPKLLSEFMVPSGGGGGAGKALHTASMISRLRR